MDLETYLRWVANTPLPTPAQVTAFAAHVTSAHSWYKHLSLLSGGAFTVFLAPDAGPAEPAAYRPRFGHLDYQWQVAPDAETRRDWRDAVLLPAELAPVSTVVLYPYALNDLTPDEWDAVHEDELPRLEAATTHPAHGELVAWGELSARLREASNVLSSEESGWVYQQVFGEPEAGTAPAFADDPRVTTCLALERALDRLRADLERSECVKVERAIERTLQFIASVTRRGA